MPTSAHPAAAPVMLGHLQLANRIVGTPHRTGMVSAGITQPGAPPREPTRPRPLTDGEVDDVVEQFIASGVNVHEAGFQLVELHAAHGYLLAQS
jgi:2,4-dienoyl-CoA reductase-like NADH-dependent reductase (Old Yellow Enzyme family)